MERNILKVRVLIRRMGKLRHIADLINTDYTKHILNGWPMNEILSSNPQQVDRIVDQGN
jgi:hypothetical protein